MKWFSTAILLAFIICSCKVTEHNIAGTYRLKSPSRTKLVLNKDKTFEFVKNFEEPGPLFFPDSTDLNYHTSGRWQLNNDQLILNSFTGESGEFARQAKDSVTHKTDITSFSFWNQYGDPVPIRLIRFPANRTKLHKSNVISFFAEDFVNTDTLEFHFYGYLPYQWLSTPGATSSNSQHRITLYEQTRQGFFQNVILTTDRKKLVSPDKAFTLYKND
ncbi:MAG TPA: hypothetical protein VFZ42_11820 [Chitinophagaceae bacterium]